MERRRDPVFAGLVLIVVGMVLFVLQNTSMEESVMFLALGGVFIAVFFYKRAYGFLVPGCILTGLGLGHVLDGMTNALAEPQLIGLGLGFLSIFVLDQMVTRSGGGWWPLVPGSFLLFIGLFDDTDIANWFFRQGWPLAIVAIGVVILLRGVLRRSRDTADRVDV